MNSKERIYKAMNLQIPDRVPAMCQLSIGHYFLNSGMDPFDIWFTSEGFSKAILRLRERYNFDGVLINLPGRDPNVEKYIQKKVQQENGWKIEWKNGGFTILPKDDNPHYYSADGIKNFPSFEEIDPENLFYIEPWDTTEIKYPFYWGFEKELRDQKDFFPKYHLDTVKYIKEKSGNQFSIHSEVFSPWSQFLELLNYENALLAIMIDPEKVKACLDRLSEGAIDLAKQQAAIGVDAVLISSAFAGAGFISKKHYQDFVLPFEKKIISEIKKDYNIPVYTHTCGKIGDRLDLMMQTGTNGIDTLDPPPIGTVDLKEAKDFLSGKVFIKGNIDPINTLLNGDLELIEKDVEDRINIGKTNGGFILSSACSIAPHTPPQNIAILEELAETYGRY